MTKFLKLAKKRCLKSTAIHQKMCCIIVRGGAIIGFGLNRGYAHAEARAVRPHVNYVGATAYIMRQNGGCSRPCPDCKILLMRAGIKRAIYMNWNKKPDIDKYKCLNLAI